MDAATQQKLLRLVGLGVRGRGAVVGVEQVREAAKQGKLAFAVVARDASENGRKKVLPMLDAKKIRYVELPSASALGAAVGRESTTVVGIVDRQLARGMRDLVSSGSVEPK